MKVFASLEVRRCTEIYLPAALVMCARSLFQNQVRALLQVVQAHGG
jgi:hypothetical protein